MPETNMTEAQKRAVTCHKGACLVLAGPGSGKTFVITQRLIHMVSSLHIPSERILVITFTKAAAMEMEKRFQAAMPGEEPWFGTFHSCFYYILRHSYASVPSRFISREEKLSLLRRLSEEVLGKDHELEIEDIERLCSLYMNNGLTTGNMPEFADISPAHLKQLYRSYHQALCDYRYMDFDDLMLCCYQLLKEHEEIRRYWQEQFRYILVDECQDMNLIQYEILKLLTGPEKNVFLVGDDDQSIYRFRGAKVSLMQRFTEEFAPVCRLQLDVNFRSTENIVQNSLKVIAQNKNRFVKKIRACHPEKTGTYVQSFVFRKEMFAWLCERLKQASAEAQRESAIIYRTNQELRSMAYRLRQNKIPYVSREDQKSIFDEDWYLDIEAYLKLGAGYTDRTYILRVANKPNRFIKREQIMQFDYVPAELAREVKHIASMRPYLAVKYIWTGIGYGRYLERKLDRDTDQWDDISEKAEELTAEMKEYASLEQWFLHVEEDRAMQRSIQKAGAGEGEGVRLMTMHASKGLEFDSVYLPDVNRGKIPRGSKLSQEEMEEERRLFYVAMTRARKELHILYVGGEKDHTLQPSVFLEPIVGIKRTGPL